jgi:hypothetical protein
MFPEIRLGVGLGPKMETGKAMQLLSGRRLASDNGSFGRNFNRSRGREDLVRRYLRGKASGVVALDGNRSTRLRSASGTGVS